jgi:high-affinity nickel-transport protein
MFASLSILVAGLLLGLRHATDPDHVVAVTTIVSRRQTLRSAGLVGTAWGIGHTLTILVVGGTIVLFKLTIPARVELALEMGVAVMLIVLGVANVAGAREPSDSRTRPLLVGVVHGLAGSAAVGLLVLTLIDSAVLAMAYLLIFGFGTIIGMMLMTLAIALPSLVAVRRMANAGRYLRLASGAMSIAFGVFLAHHIGFDGGLFTGDVPW